MAKNKARRLLDATGSSKQQRSHRRGAKQGSSHRRNKKDDPAVRRAVEKATDPRLQRAAAELAEHEAQLRALEEQAAAAGHPVALSPGTGGTVLQMPAPAAEPTADVVQIRPAPAPVVATRPRREPGRPRASAVVSVRPDPAVWAAALAVLAREGDRDVRRLRVLDAQTVLIRNRPA